MKITLRDALILFFVALAATVIGNLIVAKIVSDQASESLKSSPTGALLGLLQRN